MFSPTGAVINPKALMRSAGGKLKKAVVALAFFAMLFCSVSRDRDEFGRYFPAARTAEMCLALVIMAWLITLILLVATAMPAIGQHPQFRMEGGIVHIVTGVMDILAFIFACYWVLNLGIPVESGAIWLLGAILALVPGILCVVIFLQFLRKGPRPGMGMKAVRPSQGPIGFCSLAFCTNLLLSGVNANRGKDCGSDIAINQWSFFSVVSTNITIWNNAGRSQPVEDDADLRAMKIFLVLMIGAYAIYRIILRRGNAGQNHPATSDKRKQAQQ